MCGIAGHVARTGEDPDVDAVERMVRALHHRGPDDQGVRRVGSVALGHTRLSIVDPSPAGRQPMSDASGRWWLTYNGEIFNHLELREELEADWRGGSDTETLAEALALWGERAIPRANGLYAYAALDTARRRLWLVRDRFGVKPLYVARDARGLWFASELRALLEAGLPRQADAEVLAHALAVGWANGRGTPLAGVTRVLPGTVLDVDLDTLATEERCWYDPLECVDPERMAALAAQSPAELESEVEAALTRSVRRRLMADVPVGVMCSGGVDSSLLTHLAGQEQAGLLAFTASLPEDPARDESAFARAVAEASGVEMVTVEATEERYRRDFVATAVHLDYPMTHPSSVPMAQIARAAHERGVKVLLSGEGADELFGGYPWLNTAEQGDFDAGASEAKLRARPLYRALRRRGPVAQWPVPGPSSAVNAYETDVVDAARRAFRHHGGARGRLEAALATYPRLYLPHLLNRQDKTTMQHSVETRVPFLDPEVVALALNLPLESKRVPDRKEILRRIVRRRVPAAQIDRPKMGFDVDAHGIISRAARPGFLEGGMVAELLGTRIEETPAFLRLQVWSAEVWCRHLLGGHSVEQIESALWA